VIELPDVNVLIALFDPRYIHHEPAQAWFAGVGTEGWATCPLTENGFIRIASNPNYENLSLSVAEVGAGLQVLIATAPGSHQFWSDDISLCDTTLFDLSAVQGYRQLTDLYLLGLCQRRGATLITFDGGVQDATRALVAARDDLVRLLAP
jgi:toxin-antitoxin system PIN domain toxin